MMPEAEIAALAVKVREAAANVEGRPGDDLDPADRWARDGLRPMLYALQEAFSAAKVAAIGNEEAILSALERWTAAAVWYAGAQLRAEGRKGGLSAAVGKLTEELGAAIDAALMFRKAVEPFCTEMRFPFPVFVGGAAGARIPDRPRAAPDRMWRAADEFRARGVRLVGLLRRKAALQVLDDAEPRPGQSPEAARQARRRRAAGLGFAGSFTVKVMQADIDRLRRRGLLSSRTPTRQEIQAAFEAYVSQKLIEDDV